MANKHLPDENLGLILAFRERIQKLEDEFGHTRQRFEMYHAVLFDTQSTEDEKRIHHLKDHIITILERDFYIQSPLRKHPLHATTKAPFILDIATLRAYLDKLERLVYKRRLFEVIMQGVVTLDREAIALRVRGDVGSSKDLLKGFRAELLKPLYILKKEDMVDISVFSSYEVAPAVLPKGVITSDPHATLFSGKDIEDRFWDLEEELQKMLDEFGGKYRLLVSGLAIFIRPFTEKEEDKVPYERLSLPFHKVSAQ